MSIHRRIFLVALTSNVLLLSLLSVPTLAQKIVALPSTTAISSHWSALDFVQISEAPSPDVSYALRREGSTLRLVVEVESPPTGELPSVQFGLAAAKSITLNEGDAKVARVADGVRYEYSVPFARLIDSPTDWTKLRLGVAVAWKGGVLGMDRLREKFRHINGAPHLGLSPNATDWLPLNLNEYAATVSDRKNTINLSFVQPADGKATLVIEDASGRRVRNLIAGQPKSKGAQSIVWDGLGEDGNVAPPGNYRWRAITHNGIRPKYLFSFVNATGSNHGTFHAATSNSQFTFLGASVSEGGVDIAAFDVSGETKYGYHTPLGMGLERTALAADEKYLYVARDGVSWGQNLNDTSKPDWKNSHALSLIRFDIASGQPVDYPGGRFVTVSTHEWGPGSPQKREYQKLNLAGMALLKGKLYVASTTENALLIVDPNTGVKTGQISIGDPGAVSAANDFLLVISGNRVLRVEPDAGTTATLIENAGSDLQGLAQNAAGQIFVSDGKSHTVHVFDASGKVLREIGMPGGSYKGAYQPERMINPRGLTVAADGKLWITEERWTPKRYAMWNADTGKVFREYFGPTAYGAPGAGFDALDQTRWIGQGALWKVDFATKSARPTSLLGSAVSATNWHFVHYLNRTFLIAFGQGTFICELMADGSVEDRIMIGSTHYYAFSTNWNPPQVFIDAYKKAYPGRNYVPGQVMEKGPGVMWTDLNGDGQMQIDEFQFSTEGDDFAGAYWGQNYDDLTLRLPAIMKGKKVLLTLAPQGVLPGGAPKYSALNEALKVAPVLQTTLTTSVESVTDHRGNTIFNTDPRMTAFAPTGKLLWEFPNKWTGVHGSHDAPLPKVGEMQGAIFFLGMAPLDASSDVFVMNGNHGRYFALTSDGFYLDEMFKDVRLGGANDVYMAGGEAFGGVFEKSEKNGKYYLQAGGIEYRIFEIGGLDSVRRSSGDFKVSPAQASSAENRLERRLAPVAQSKNAVARYAATPPTIDGQDGDWTGEVNVSWNKNNQFPVTTRVAYDESNLYLHYTVQDDSPWVNTGKDWQLLFKSGDSIDLQLGTDPAVGPTRSGPVPGDLRVLIAPYQNENIAVLYRHRVPGTNKTIAFTSPWRGENVDVVKKLDTAKIAILREGGRYRVEASIPLSELGLKPQNDASYKADFGTIYGDEAGTINLFRNYWSNQATGLVNDVPGEIMLSPNLWGALRFEAKP